MFNVCNSVILRKNAAITALCPGERVTGKTLSHNAKMMQENDFTQALGKKG